MSRPSIIPAMVAILASTPGIAPEIFNLSGRPSKLLDNLNA